MSYPIMTDIFRCQVVMQGISGLPEDQYVNNWYFRNDESLEGPAVDIPIILDAFYGEINGTATSTVDSYMAPFNDVHYKIYDLGEQAPRYPIVDPVLASWSGGTAGDELPREVACCLSFKGGPGPRERGRVYIGPLRDVAVETTNGTPHPTTNLVTNLLESARNVLNTSRSQTWVVASPTGGSTVVVNEGWVDDAFDTQRSRGVAPSSRRLFDTDGITT